MGELEAPGGETFSFMGFVAPDGVQLTYMYRHCSSSSGVKDRFEQEISRAKKVRKRRELRDGDGAIIGERAEIVSPTNQAGKTAVAVIWTLHSTF